jgi:hypothetical protein
MHRDDVDAARHQRGTNRTQAEIVEIRGCPRILILALAALTLPLTLSEDNSEPEVA